MSIQLPHIWEKIKPMIAELNSEERLAIIQAIAAEERSAGEDPLANEQNAWFSLPLKQRRQYPGEYIAIYQGKIIDHDLDQRALYLRVRNELGINKALILSSDWDEPPGIDFRSPIIRLISPPDN